MSLMLEMVVITMMSYGGCEGIDGLDTSTTLEIMHVRQHAVTVANVGTRSISLATASIYFSDSVDSF